MKKEDIRLGMTVEAQESELYPFQLKGFVGKVITIKENPNCDGTCIEVGEEEDGYWFLPEELEEV